MPRITRAEQTAHAKAQNEKPRVQGPGRSLDVTHGTQRHCQLASRQVMHSVYEKAPVAPGVGGLDQGRQECSVEVAVGARGEEGVWGVCVTEEEVGGGHNQGMAGGRDTRSR